MENCSRKNPKTVGILTIVGLALSGCMNGATTPAPPPDVTRIFVGDLDTTTSVTVSSDGSQLDISNGGGSVTLSSVGAPPGLPPGLGTGFSFYSVSTAAVNAFAVRATTHSGAGVVTVMVAPALGLPGSIVEGTGETSLPTNGTASFTGGYAGLTSTNIGALDRSVPILGTADLNADFATLSISGTISGRFQLDGGIPYRYAPIVLNPAAIQANGTFSGTATGGKIIRIFGSSTSSTTGGGFKGVLVGTTGNEVVGGLVLEHLSNGSLHFFEDGVFFAN